MIFAGGVLGALTRWLLGLGVFWMEGTVDPLLATLAPNILGCLVIGLITGWSERRQLSPRHHAMPFGITGFCGAFTTFSSFALESVTLWPAPWVAAGYVAATLILCGAAVALGQHLGLRPAGRRR